LSQHDDFNPAKKSQDQDLSATVPDIFASMAKSAEVPAESTAVKLGNAATLKIPGVWGQQKAGLRSSSVSYKRAESVSAVITVGSLELDKRGEELIKSLCAKEARALQDFELSGLQAALAESRRPDKFEISAGSTELLHDRVVLVVQGDLAREQVIEAIIIFPERIGFGQLSFKAIRPEFILYFDHLKLALQSIEWT
jgi:hypothetical protein